METSNPRFGERKFRQSFRIPIAVAGITATLLYLVWTLSGEPRLGDGSPFLEVCLIALLINAAVFVAIFKTVLTVSDDGIRRESLLGVREVRWADVVETRCGVSVVRPRIPVGLTGALMTMARKPRPIKLKLKVVAVDGTAVSIGGSYRRSRDAIGIVLGRVIPRMVFAVRTKISRGEPVSFGALQLSSSAVTWKSRTPIPVSSITQAEIAGGRLRIKCDRKWRAAVSVRCDRVPNVLVFLEVIETLAPQLRPMRIDPLAKVRL